MERSTVQRGRRPPKVVAIARRDHTDLSPGSRILPPSSRNLSSSVRRKDSARQSANGVHTRNVRMAPVQSGEFDWTRPVAFTCVVRSADGRPCNELGSVGQHAEHFASGDPNARRHVLLHRRTSDLTLSISGGAERRLHAVRRHAPLNVGVDGPAPAGNGSNSTSENAGPSSRSATRLTSTTSLPS